MLRTEERDFDGAVDAWREAVNLARHVASLPQVTGAYAEFVVTEMLGGLAVALENAGHKDEAEQTASARTELRRRIGLPPEG